MLRLCRFLGLFQVLGDAFNSVLDRSFDLLGFFGGFFGFLCGLILRRFHLVGCLAHLLGGLLHLLGGLVRFRGGRGWLTAEGEQGHHPERQNDFLHNRLLLIRFGIHFVTGKYSTSWIIANWPKTRSNRAVRTWKDI